MLPSTEQVELRAVLRKSMAGPRSMSAVANPAAGCDRALWARLTSELGLATIGVPERLGGAGGGMRDLVVLCGEVGRVLAPVPVLGHSVAVAAITAGGTEVADLRAAVLSGELLATWAPEANLVVRQGRLSGTVPVVLDGGVADLAVLPAAGELYAVRGDADGVRRIPLSTMDRTRTLVELALDNVPARRLACADPTATMARLTDMARVLLAAEQAGGLARCVELAVAHAKSRVQFSRPIGSFQAVKHRCADMFATGEIVDAVVWYAAWAADEAPAELASAALDAKVLVATEFCRVAADAVHVHGGLGFTWEHEVGWHYKRARTSARLFGDRAALRLRLADRLMAETLP
ncbi:acyl-CoA dehydrogenase family protein [Nocardia sp. NPDC051321]|uniref:acyl-CoA dehydrogenase family protein n=1 Tax=Nocardia sp. NPDC051321 TaxID=3364323 RepID=UPI00379CA966